MTPKLLRLKKFDGLVQLSRIFGLFDPITSGMIFVRPTDEVWSNGLRHTAARAASRLNVEILSDQFRLSVFAHFGHAAKNQLDFNIVSLVTPSGKCRQEPVSDIDAVEDFNVGNLSLDYVNEQHSFFCVQVQATMARTIAPFGFWLSIERRAEVVSTPATVLDRQLRNLRCKFGRALFLKKLFQFKGQRWEYFDKQHGAFLLLENASF